MWRLVGDAFAVAMALLVLAFGLVLAGWWPEAPGVVVVSCPDGLTAVRAEPPHPCPEEG